MKNEQARIYNQKKIKYNRGKKDYKLNGEPFHSASNMTIHPTDQALLTIAHCKEKFINLGSNELEGSLDGCDSRYVYSHIMNFPWGKQV